MPQTTPADRAAIERIKSDPKWYPRNCANCWRKADTRAQLDERFGWRTMDSNDPLSVRPQARCTARCRN